MVSPIALIAGFAVAVVAADLVDTNRIRMTSSVVSGAFVNVWKQSEYRVVTRLLARSPVHRRHDGNDFFPL